MAIDIAEYKTLYIKTSRELIGAMMQALEKLKNDKCNQAEISEFHRAAHSFKGQSLVMGYTQSGLAAKVLEQIFRDMKDQLTCATDELIPLVERVVRKFADSVDNIERQLGELDLAEETEELSKLTSIPVV